MQGREFSQKIRRGKHEEDIPSSRRDREYPLKGDRSQGERGGERGSPALRGAERPKVKFASLVINAGTVNKFNPKTLLSLINLYVGDQAAQVGKIDVQFSHTIFDVDADYQEEVMKAFKKASYKGIKLVVMPMKSKKKK